MSDNIKDLDALVPTDKRVSLGQKVYVVPGDIPMEVFVRINKAGLLEEEDEAAAIEEMVGALVDLFSWNTKGRPNEDGVREDVEKALRRMGVATISKVLSAVYGQEDQPEAEDANPPDDSGTTTQPS